MERRTQDDIRKLIKHVNAKDWWHVKPIDLKAYEKRGKFLASSFGDAEFYGRPNDVPEKVTIKSPLIGDNDIIERELIGRVESYPEITVRKRLALDARLRRAALQKGYDSIVLMSEIGFQKFRKEGKIPRSLELNIVDLKCLRPTGLDQTNKPEALSVVGSAPRA
ncbi:MAG TPA: hypothetical protein VI685_12360 [Candidatus Angelobacter sp.]